MTQGVKSIRPVMVPGLATVVSTAVVVLVVAAGAWVVAYGVPTGEAAGWWVLIGTSALLVVAVVGLRYVDPRRMSLLKKCLIVSVLVHVLIALCFSAVVVTRQVVRWVRSEERMTPAVNLQLSREMEVREQVRQQVQELPPMFENTAQAPQQVDSPLPPIVPKIEPVGVPGADLKQLSNMRNPIAPTIPAAPVAPELTTPLLPVRPDLVPMNEITPLPSPIADVSRPATHLPGLMNEQLARATTPVPGNGIGALGAPPASLTQGLGAGGSATGSGTGKPFSLWSGMAPPPAALVPPAVITPPPPSVPELKNQRNTELLPQRGFDERQRALQKHGGTSETEAAVARALLYLSRTQHADGHWTKIMDKPGERATDAHDNALTGLAVLCFLAADHTPEKAGPYQDTVRRGVAYLMAHQDANGDVRGDGNMYDQGIASLALGEAAAMTPGDRAMREAAHRAAQFIVEAQNGRGGWRYSPRDLFTDTSVTGWQVLAMHSAQRTGFAIPEQVKRKATDYLDSVSGGKRGMLTGYLTASATPTMTAEAAFTRMLLGQSLSADDLDEAADYVVQRPPARDSLNYYYIYYGSLALMQMQGANWQRWNTHTSRLLLSLQELQGAAAGSWAPEESEWGTRGGRIYTTALATLTLEVYYRYLPMYAK